MAASAAGEAFSNMAGDFAAAAVRTMHTQMTSWGKAPSNIVLDAAADTGGGSLVQKVHDFTAWLQLVLGTLSVMFLGVRFAMTRAHQAEDTATDAAMTIARVVFTSALWVPIVVALTRMTDAFSAWIIAESGNSASEAMRTLLAEDYEDGNILASALVTGFLASPGGASILMLIGIILMLCSFLQMLFMYVRQGFLILLAAVMPIIAASGGLDTGRDAWGKAKAWTIALLLFKPAASLIYAIAFWAVGDIGEEDGTGAMTALLLVALASFTLPALVSLLAPAASGVPQGPSGMAVVGGAVGAAAMVATRGGLGGRGAAAMMGGSTRSMAAGPGPGRGGGGGGFGGGGGGGGPMPVGGGMGRAMEPDRASAGGAGAGLAGGGGITPGGGGGGGAAPGGGGAAAGRAAEPDRAPAGAGAAGGGAAG
ncbi:MAG: hypothetical protein Q4B12_06570, partial [Bowdeniella nasicola]|nr:hypothetical protein [Bowdeniella nasicola]